MDIDAVTFRSIVKSLLPRATTLSRDEAEAIVHVAQLAGGVDLDEDPSEVRLQRQLVSHVCTLANVTPDSIAPASPLPIDDEERRAWIVRLAKRLTTSGVAELAYVIAHLITVSDLEIAPVESVFVESLRDGLGIGRERAAELAVTISSMITPGVALAAPA